VRRRSPALTSSVTSRPGRPMAPRSRSNTSIPRWTWAPSTAARYGSWLLTGRTHSHWGTSRRNTRH
jgi:hypothetical protein